MCSNIYYLEKSAKKINMSVHFWAAFLTQRDINSGDENDQLLHISQTLLKKPVYSNKENVVLFVLLESVTPTLKISKRRQSHNR